MAFGLRRGGYSLSWSEVEISLSSKFLGWTRLAEGDLPAFAWRSRDAEVTFYSGETGLEVWSGTSHHAWPHLSHNGSKWDFANEQVHKNVENRIREGGGGIAELITKLRLTTEERRRIYVLREFLQTEDLVEDSGKPQ